MVSQSAGLAMWFVGLRTKWKWRSTCENSSEFKDSHRALLSTGPGHTPGKAALPIGDHHTHTRILSVQKTSRTGRSARPGLSGATPVILLGAGTRSLFPGGQLPWPPWSQILLPAEDPRGWWWVCEIIHPFQTRQNATITADFTKSHGNQETSLLLFVPPARLDAKGDESSESEVCVFGGGWAHTRVSTPSISCVRSFLQEFSQWPLEVFPFHMVAAVQFFRLFIYSYVSRPTTLLAYKQWKLQHKGLIISSFGVILLLAKAWLVLQRKEGHSLQVIPLLQGKRSG